MARRHVSAAALGQGAANASPGNADGREIQLAAVGHIQSTANSTNSAGNHHERKAWLRVQAQLLLAGVLAELAEGDDGQPLLIVSLALTRSFTDIAEAQGWAAHVGVRQ
jgi:hypothetical protein